MRRWPALIIPARNAKPWITPGRHLLHAVRVAHGQLWRLAYRSTKVDVMLLVLVNAETVAGGLFDRRDVEHLQGTSGFGTAGERRRWMLWRGFISQRSPTAFVGLLRV